MKGKSTTIMTTLKYHDIKETYFWLAPDSGGSLLISLITPAGREIKILITQIVDLENFLPDMIPGRIYIDDILIELKSKEEASVLTLLSNMIRDNRLGHKQGLEVIRAKETIAFFNSQEAEKIKNILDQYISEKTMKGNSTTIMTLKYHDIKHIFFWMAPDSGSSLIISLITAAGREIKILITQIVDLENFLPDMIPGRIYIDDILIELKSKEEAIVLTLLSNMIRDNRLGDKQGLAVNRAKETITFFNSQEAEKMKNILDQ